MVKVEGCVFCDIVAGTENSELRYEDDEVMVIVNALRWVPVMLLVLPKDHKTQSEFWAGDTLGRAGKIAVEMGEKYCPGGYRLLANFGHDAMQSQEHGHIHVLGGMYLGPYA